VYSGQKCFVKHEKKEKGKERKAKEETRQEKRKEKKIRNFFSASPPAKTAQRNEKAKVLICMGARETG